MFRNGNTMPGTKASEITPALVDFPLHTEGDVMIMLVQLLSDQYAFFAAVSKEWRNACGKRPRITQALRADPSVFQLV